MRVRIVTTKADVLYVPEMAEKLGISSEALRARVYRMTALSKAEDLPKPFMLGGKWAWRRATVDDWLAEKEATAEAPSRRK